MHPLTPRGCARKLIGMSGSSASLRRRRALRLGLGGFAYGNRIGFERRQPGIKQTLEQLGGPALVARRLPQTARHAPRDSEASPRARRIPAGDTAWRCGRLHGFQSTIR